MLRISFQEHSDLIQIQGCRSCRISLAAAQSFALSSSIITAFTMILQVLIFLSALLTFVRGVDISGSILSNAHLPSPAFLPPSTSIVLSSTNLEYRTHPAPNGEFIFRNVTAGPSYILQIECLTHDFLPLRIDTQNEDVEVYQTFRGNQWSHRGAKFAYPIEIAPSGKADYYVVPPVP